LCRCSRVPGSVSTMLSSIGVKSKERGPRALGKQNGENRSGIVSPASGGPFAQLRRKYGFRGFHIDAQCHAGRISTPRTELISPRRPPWRFADRLGKCPRHHARRERFWQKNSPSKIAQSERISCAKEQVLHGPLYAPAEPRKASFDVFANTSAARKNLYGAGACGSQQQQQPRN